MGSVTNLPWGRPLIRDDLDTMPDDGHRYELIDGTLLVSPAPSTRHQSALLSLAVALRAACPPELRCLVAPFEVVLGPGSVFQPDVLIARHADLADRNLPAPPVLAVEVLSPSTRSIDRLLKFDRYATAGVEHYWIVDPDEPSLTAWRRGSGGSYEQVGHAVGNEAFETSEPVRVTIRPTDLIDI